MRITCATRLFQSGVNEKQTRETTGHKSDSLFRYQKPSEIQVRDVSNTLGPPIATTSTNTCSSNEESKIEDKLLDLFDEGITDEILAVLDISEDKTRENSTSIVNPIFNNCSVNFWMK